jgi:serine phosphatase RsbU (regulator of sigma subunit)
MKQIIVIILLFISRSLFSQLDSLLAVYKETKSDTSKLNVINKISFLYEQLNLDSASVWAQKGFLLSSKISDRKGLGNFYNHKGRLCLYTQKYDSAIFYFSKAYPFFEKINYVKGMISSNNNIGAVYAEVGDNDKALQYHFKNVEIAKKNSENESLGNSYINIANAYNQSQKYYLSVQFTLKAIQIFDSLKLDKSLGTCYYNLGASNFQLKNYEKAIEYCLKSNDYFVKSNALAQMANNYSLLSNTSINQKKYGEAVLFARQGVGIAAKYSNIYTLFFLYSNLSQSFRENMLLDSALIYSDKALKIARDFNYDVFKLKSYFGKGMTLYYLNDFKNSILYLDSSLVLSVKLNDKNLMADCNANLAMNYKKLHKYDMALSYLENAYLLKDTIFESSNSKSILEFQTMFETEKKELQIKNQSFEIESQEKQNQQKSLIILFGALALVGTGFFAAMAFLNFKKAKKANIIIENQKMEVELKNEEVTHQKELVEEKQKEIIDSINYAKRIQQAVLTGEDVWKKVSKEHFILFKPKDIVSGDFYWAYNTPNNRSVFALADCTGHGVPGGFMSMLGNSFLNEIVVENKIFKADEILNKLRSKIIQALEQKGGTQQKDGMDISLCVWNKLDNTLEFAGANNPLWLVSKNENAVTELVEVKADKMPIGTYLENEVPFSSTTIQLQKGDIIFLCTDGYADQFGGPKGKKYKYKPLIDSLIKNSNLSMEEQKVALELAFNDWKHHHEQVDDVSLIGVRV